MSYYLPPSKRVENLAFVSYGISYRSQELSNTLMTSFGEIFTNPSVDKELKNLSKCTDQTNIELIDALRKRLEVGIGPVPVKPSGPRMVSVVETDASSQPE
jgi:hypothetical protein